MLNKDSLQLFIEEIKPKLITSDGVWDSTVA